MKSEESGELTDGTIDAKDAEIAELLEQFVRREALLPLPFVHIGVDLLVDQLQTRMIRSLEMSLQDKQGCFCSQEE
jgi:hypothetical protein